MIIKTKDSELLFTETISQKDLDDGINEAVWTDSENNRYYLRWFGGDAPDKPTVIVKMTSLEKAD